VRVVSATHRNLRERVAKGSFREDLYYRINVLDVALPPLRDRDGDLPLLVEHFLDGFAETDAQGLRRAPTLSLDAYAALAAYGFPGNVRELDHAIEHAVVLAGRGEITLDHLPAVIAEAAPTSGHASLLPAASHGPAAVMMPLVAATRQFEEGHLRRALAATGGQARQSAELLGISRKSLWEKLRVYDLGAAVSTQQS